MSSTEMSPSRASLAAESAAEFPLMPTWPETQMKTISLPSLVISVYNSKIWTKTGWSYFIDHEPAYTPPPPRGGGGEGFYHMVISGYLDHQSTQFRLSASELLLFLSVVLVLINALYGIPNCDDLVS